MEVEWTYPSPKVISVFNVWVTRDDNWRKPHYPCYKVVTNLVASAFSLECAERLVREIAEDNRNSPYRHDLHSIRIIEQPVGQLYGPYGNLSEYVYDREGRLLDKRATPPGETWNGRSLEEIRFNKGDLCEVVFEREAILGIVQRVPPMMEEASQMHLDDSDDCYTVLTRKDEYDFHVDSLKLFKPSFKISAQTERKLRRYFAEEETLWMRLKIASTTAEAQLRGIMNELGWEVDIRFPRWIEDSIGMEIKGVPGFPDGLRLELDQKKAHDRMDRVRISFLRLAGQHPEGRGYRLKRVTDYLKKPIEPEAWKF